MKENQTLNGLMARCIEGLDHAIEKYQPESVIAQGDTTTVAASAIVAFHRRLPFIHVEAGLRTGNLQSPWPEEFNRRLFHMQLMFIVHQHHWLHKIYNKKAILSQL